jgi:ABC-type molybdate transport system ATPase subunit
VPDLTVLDLAVERGDRLILNGCSATFGGATRTVLWGQSGAGKSTLLAAIAGLIPPKRGRMALGATVFFSSSDHVDLPPHRRRVGYVFQDLALWPHLTAMQHLRLVGQSVGLDQMAARALLDSVGLNGLEDRRPQELSGGEQQRLAIARALAGKPAVLLLDEPFSSVDRKTRQALYALVRAISPEIPGPTIYVTHSAEDARSLAECAFELEDGILAAADRPWDDPVA